MNDVFDANGNKPLSIDEQSRMRDELEVKFREIQGILKIDSEDPNSTDTPRRMAKMYVDELLKGRFNEPPNLTVFPNRSKVNELVISKGIKVMSLCSHHWQPISPCRPETVGPCA